MMLFTSANKSGQFLTSLKWSLEFQESIFWGSVSKILPMNLPLGRCYQPLYFSMKDTCIRPILSPPLLPHPFPGLESCRHSFFRHSTVLTHFTENERFCLQSTSQSFPQAVAAFFRWSSDKATLISRCIMKRLLESESFGPKSGATCESAKLPRWRVSETGRHLCLSHALM